MMLTALVIILAFSIMGSVAVFIVVNGYINAIVGVALVPFMIAPSTRFLGQQGLSMIVNAGVALGVTSMTLSIGEGVLSNMNSDLHFTAVTLRAAVNVAIASIVVTVLSFGVGSAGGKAAGGLVGAALTGKRLAG